MTRLTFVTGNAGKVREMQERLAGAGIEVVQDDRGYPEVQADRLQDVAAAGARWLLTEGMETPFMLEDAGLFVAALRGFPGVYSRHALDTIGCEGILRLLRDVERESRTAAFEACLTYVASPDDVRCFTGRCKGRIADKAAGTGGFGFDPIFIPDSDRAGRTFAELPLDEKGRISHRGAAADAFLASLEKTAKT